MTAPPELDGAAEESIEEEATQLLQRVALVSGEDVPDVDIIDVVTQVEEWLATNSLDDDSVSMIHSWSQSKITVLGGCTVRPWATSCGAMPHWTRLVPLCSDDILTSPTS